MPRKESKPIRKTTKGKGRNYLSTSEGAGMTDYVYCPEPVDFVGLDNQVYGQFTRSGKMYVYFHSTLDTGEVYYVGIGKYNRCNQVNQRNQYWKNVKTKHGLRIHIFKTGLTLEESKSIEISLISLWNPKCNLTAGGDYTSVKSKKVYCYDLSGRFLKEFDSITEANIYLCKRINDSRICRCLTGDRKSFCGYMWSDKKTDRIEPYKKNTTNNIREVHKYDLLGNYQKSFSKISDYKGGSRTGISNVLDKNKTHNNSFWRSYKKEKIEVTIPKPALKKPNLVLDNETGNIFPSVSKAAKYLGIGTETLRRKLIGVRKNNTNMIYYEK